MIPPAKTGSDNTSKKEVIRTDQIKSGMRNNVICAGRMLKIVTIMLIEPKIEEAPAKCMDKIARSTEGPAWPLMLLSGGYSVQPVPAPSRNVEETSKYIDHGKSQKLRLFKRGKAMSGAPSNVGTIQLPKPPIKKGITKKKIMIKP